MSCAPLYHGLGCGQIGARVARPRSRSLKRSAIATIAALTGPVVIAGMIEASHTKRLSIPRTLEIRAHHRLVSDAHAAGADRMMMGEGRLLQESALLGARSHRWAGQILPRRRQSDNALRPPTARACSSASR